MPAPKTPVANPRRAGSYQLLRKGIPAAKLVPAIPRKKPMTIISGYDFSSTATATRITNGTDSSSSAVNMTRPPNRGVNTPTTIRPSEPTRMGTAIRIDFCEAFRSISPGLA